MKKIFVTLLATAGLALVSYGQGTINFGNSASSLVQWERVTPGTFASATSADGAKATLWWAPAGTTDLNLFQIISGVAVNVGTPQAGRFQSTAAVTIPAGTGATGISAGGAAALIVRAYIGQAWDTATVRGTSSIINLASTGNPNPPAGTPTVIATLYSNIQMTAVPEPSSMALAGLGAASLLIFRRRK